MTRVLTNMTIRVHEFYTDVQLSSHYGYSIDWVIFISKIIWNFQTNEMLKTGFIIIWYWIYIIKYLIIVWWSVMRGATDLIKPKNVTTLFFFFF